MCFNSLIINVLSFCFCLSFVIVLRLACNRVFCKVSNFYHQFFVFYFFFCNFAPVKRFVNTYNGVDMMHKEMYFSVFFNVICLEVSNILLTHTHTHTHTHLYKGFLISELKYFVNYNLRAHVCVARKLLGKGIAFGFFAHNVLCYMPTVHW